MSGQPRVITDQPLTALGEIRDKIKKAHQELADLHRQRNRAIVDAVDNGYPQDQVAAAAGVGPSRITAILADPRHYDVPAAS